MTSRNGARNWNSIQIKIIRPIMAFVLKLGKIMYNPLSKGDSNPWPG
jgi:hypothetical protein